MDDIDDFERSYFKESKSKKLIMDLDVKPNIDFEGFSNSFSINDSFMANDVPEPVKNKSVLIGNKTLNEKKGGKSLF